MVEAIEAGIRYDLGSGSSVDVVVIKKDGSEFKRNIKHDNVKMASSYKYNFPIGNTPFLKKTEIKLEKKTISEEILNKDKMMTE